MRREVTLGSRTSSEHLLRTGRYHHGKLADKGRISAVLILDFRTKIKRGIQPDAVSEVTGAPIAAGFAKLAAVRRRPLVSSFALIRTDLDQGAL